MSGKNDTPLLGGQAVIEGVMMRFGGSVATAVRRADGRIVIRKEKFRPLSDRQSWAKLPILRGAVGLIEMLSVGISTLNFSAEMAMEDAEAAKSPSGMPTGSPTANVDLQSGAESRTGKKQGLALALTLAVALVAGLALFFVLPLWLATALFDVEQQPLLFNLTSGAIRVAIFLAYLIALSFMKDIRRLFEYHGAEHKTVAAMEHGEELTPAACSRYSRFHPRCGTSFLLVVMVSAILLFAVLDAVLLSFLGTLTLPVRLATHLPLIPLVMGISYECIRFSARHVETAVGRMIVAPGLWLQRVTTREPDAGQLEVAIAALRSALEREEHLDGIAAAVTAQPISVN